MSTAGDPEAQELLARQQSKCLEIIRANPNAGAYGLMLAAMNAGFSMGVDEIHSRFVAKMAIKGAKE